MARHLDLRHHADAALPGIGDNPAHLGLRVEQAVGTLLLLLGEAGGLEAPPLVVDQVPVEDVQLHSGHGIEGTLEDLEGNEVARAVDHQPAPGEARPVFDDDARHLKGVGARLEQLQEGLHAVQDAGWIVRAQQRAAGGHLQAVGFVVAGTLAARHQRGRPAFERDHQLAGLAAHAGHEPGGGSRQTRILAALERHAKRAIDAQAARAGAHPHRQRHQGWLSRAQLERAQPQDGQQSLHWRNASGVRPIMERRAAQRRVVPASVSEQSASQTARAMSMVPALPPMS